MQTVQATNPSGARNHRLASWHLPAHHGAIGVGEKFSGGLWRQRSREGKTVLDLLNYVVWGNGSVAARLWNAIRSDQWAIPHIGLSSLGEVVGWARPDEFPPRNMRTSKGLRALGYNVRIGV